MSRLFKASRGLRYALEPTTSKSISYPGPSLSPNTRGFSSQPSRQKKAVQFPPRPKPPPDLEIDESFLKGSGPGGQKINKTSSAVQLKHLPTGLVIKCQATRSRTENRKIARQLLADKLDDMSKGDESRSSVVAKAKSKKTASAAKKKRRKYRKLDGAGEGATAGATGDGENAWEDEEELDDDVDNKVDDDVDAVQEPLADHEKPQHRPNHTDKDKPEHVK